MLLTFIFLLLFSNPKCLAVGYIFYPQTHLIVTWKHEQINDLSGENMIPSNLKSLFFILTRINIVFYLLSMVITTITTCKYSCIL